ncbi:hypothetical protein ABF107_002982 [Vibrio parahaemolyticus]|uniref:hypothetical protein n=1 Tax=Vibrio parahaemolyticus TaxID=670 RepID=UPI0005F10A9A|nr:hypothetical protein [Vibrio parahaemolyticus]EHK0045367.1 hypothetical protein [Vibrio parahaemolyticus]EIU7880244.1 hypothetical protein [Vibrio parahaemolyticus]
MTENLHLVVPLIALAAGMVFVLFDAGIGRKRKNDELHNKVSSLLDGYDAAIREAQEEARAKNEPKKPADEHEALKALIRAERDTAQKVENIHTLFSSYLVETKNLVYKDAIDCSKAEKPKGLTSRKAKYNYLPPQQEDKIVGRPVNELPKGHYKVFKT